MATKKLLYTKKKVFYVKDSAQDYHTQFGVIKAKDLQQKDGSIVTSNTGKEFVVLTPQFIDLYAKIKRDAQIIPLKDVGAIITTTGMGAETRVLDAGAGSGALACFFAHLVKEVVTYDIRDDFIKIVEQNITTLGLKNITVRKQNIYDSIYEKDTAFDVVSLDLPEPWKVLPHIHQALTIGGFLVSYSPTIPQVQDFVNAVHTYDRLIHLKTVEIIQREWDVEGRKVRPKSIGIGHSGFLSFVRFV
ncbi:methyltransferase domain-containing protein [Candidatus Woesearchaeota archaeon]|nr:methyltransferase domain-containing protein [Candidatus Woesearchaeota archaeon]